MSKFHSKCVLFELEGRYFHFHQFFSRFFCAYSIVYMNRNFKSYSIFALNFESPRWSKFKIPGNLAESKLRLFSNMVLTGLGIHI
jgi:hypothetical protein